MKFNSQICFILAICLIVSSLNAQCPVEEVQLTSQSQVDSFLINYPNCENLEVDLTITNYWGDISDLQAFDNIKSIKGDLSIIANRQLIHLDAFNNLETVSGSVSIDGNTSLETIKGFSKLKSAYKLRVAYNDNLEELYLGQSLDTLTYLEIHSLKNKLKIFQQSSFKVSSIWLIGLLEFNFKNSGINIDGLTLENVESKSNFIDLSEVIPRDVGALAINNYSDFSIEGLSKFESLELCSFDGIANLFLEVDKNPDRTFRMVIWDCGGFENLDQISSLPIQELSVAFCDNIKQIESIDSLGLLKSFSLLRDPNIDNIDGLEHSSTLEELFIVDNYSLSDCALEPICHVIETNPENATIRNNQGRCTDIDSVSFYCQKTSDTFLEGETEIIIYPNPANTFVNISSEHDLIRFEVYNSLGQLVDLVHSDFSRINIRHLKSGRYFLKIFGEGRLEVHTLIVE